MIRIVLVFIMTSLLAAGARANGRILDFTSHITIHPNGSMTVREIIRFNIDKKREPWEMIYRDLPTTSRVSSDMLIRRDLLPFEVLSVSRNDDTNEILSTTLSFNRCRIYLDLPGFFLIGTTTFNLTYRANHQLNFYSDHDELRWHVTGPYLDYPIDHIKAVVYLPKNARPIATRAHTGEPGTKGKDYIVSVSSSNSTVFETTRGLQPGEDMTIMVSFPKGVVQEPEWREKILAIIFGHLPLFSGLAGLFLLLVYYLLAWKSVKRISATKRIALLTEPPGNLSPAAMRFIRNLGYDDKVMTAAILNLAVKGKLTIVEEHGKYSLVKQDDHLADLSLEERKLFVQLLGSRNSIDLNPSNASTIRQASYDFYKTLDNRYKHTRFQINLFAYYIGIVITFFTMALLINTSCGSDMTMFAYPALIIWSTLVFGMALKFFNSWRHVSRNRRTNTGPAILRTLFYLPFFVAEAFLIVMLIRYGSYCTTGTLLALSLVHVVFYQKFKEPVFGGRHLMNRIEGFRLFLGAPRRKESVFRQAADKSPAMFERYLPYALALDVENEWANGFSDTLRTSLPPAKGGYRPIWYVGTAKWPTLGAGAGGFTSSLSSSLSHAISSSKVSPGFRARRNKRE